MRELKDEVRTYYENNRISFAQLAANSERIFGQKIAVDTIKGWSAREDGGWKKPDIKHDEKLDVIGNLIFERIEEDGTNLDTRDLVALANTYINLVSKTPPPDDGQKKPTFQEIIDLVNAHE